MEKITADEAARLIHDGDSILISGSGGGHAVPEALLAAVERRFLAERKPHGLTSVSVVGVGDRAALGATHLAHEGLLRRAITSAASTRMPPPTSASVFHRRRTAAISSSIV